MCIDKTLYNHSQYYNVDMSYEGIPIFNVQSKLTTISDHFSSSIFVYRIENLRKNIVLCWRMAFSAKKMALFHGFAMGLLSFRNNFQKSFCTTRSRNASFYFVLFGVKHPVCSSWFKKFEEKQPIAIPKQSENAKLFSGNRSTWY